MPGGSGATSSTPPLAPGSSSFGDAYFLRVSFTVVDLCVFAYFSVTKRPVLAERLSVDGFLLLANLLTSAPRGNSLTFSMTERSDTMPS
jgi:hypothetical protein